MTYQIILTFNSFKDLTTFIIEKKLLEDINFKNKNPNEKRGSKTYLLHQKVKQYKELNPNLSYKECLKIVSKNNK